MKKYKVLYLINFAPNYRDKFLTELGKYVDLTVTAYPGNEANLTDPEQRIGYRFIPLKRIKFLNFNFNLNEFTLANDDYDVIIVGYTLWNPFRMINLLRKKKRVICEGMFYGRTDNIITNTLRNTFINAGEGILVYSERVKDRLEKIAKKPIIVFNNTSFSKSEISSINIPPIHKTINILWVGRYQERKKLYYLYELAKLDTRINIRLIGPGVKKGFQNYKKLVNLELFDEIYGNELKNHFEWSHLICSPAALGLLAMNAARFGRPILVGNDKINGAETQLAIDAKQDFIDFSDLTSVKKYIDSLFKNPSHLQTKADAMSDQMQNYTIENMAEKYFKAIKGEWN